MANLVPSDYLRSAQRRLGNAAELYRGTQGRQYEATYLELADVAMLVWSAGIDVVSILMLRDGYTRLGTSGTRQGFVKTRLHERHPNLALRSAWAPLAKLHNFQHNLDTTETRFAIACNFSGQLIEMLNGLLPAQLRLPGDAYAWLSGVR